MTSVRIQSLGKSFGSIVALDNVSLSIAAGELFFLLGPSGCGKSTLLRIVAGLLEPSAGKIFFDDRDVTHLKTEKRNAVMCFQSYALWPHMSVRENVRFGLSVRKLPRAQQNDRIDQTLALVQMESLAHRKPNELSGGQQQRVALARALAVQPACLLLDEPLSNLDAKLRGEMRTEIRRICKSAGLTTIYVTHDQKEALSTADRIAVLNAGRLAQIGTPAELYHRPASTFVARFIGNTNLLNGTVIEQANGEAQIETAAGRIITKSNSVLTHSQQVTLAIRPEQIRPARDGQGARNKLFGKIIETTFLGESSEHILLVNGQRLKMISASPLLSVPKEMTVGFDPADVIVLTE